MVADLLLMFIILLHARLILKVNLVAEPVTYTVIYQDSNTK